MELLFGSGIWSHHAVSRLLVAGEAGDHDIATVHPHPHVAARYKERVTVVAVLAAEFPVDPDPLAHRDLPGKFHVTVAPFRVCRECLPGLFEQYTDTLPGDLFCRRVPGFLFHVPCTGSRLWYTISVLPNNLQDRKNPVLSENCW
jgi:hypothetical protein